MGGLTRRELAGRAVAAGTAVAIPPGFSRMLTAAGWAARDPVNDLRHRVRGPVLRPRDSRALVYDERWQARRPKAVVQALDALDVRAVLAWAQETGTPLAVRSGGHSYAGTSTVVGGVVPV